MRYLRINKTATPSMLPSKPAQTLAGPILASTLSTSSFLVIFELASKFLWPQSACLSGFRKVHSRLSTIFSIRSRSRWMDLEVVSVRCGFEEKGSLGNSRCETTYRRKDLSLVGTCLLPTCSIVTRDQQDLRSLEWTRHLVLTSITFVFDSPRNRFYINNHISGSNTSIYPVHGGSSVPVTALLCLLGSAFCCYDSQSHQLSINY